MELSRSDSLTELIKAMVQVQAKMGHAEKSSTNPRLGSRYADLAEVISTVRPHLTEAGLAVLQPVFIEDDAIAVTTILKVKRCTAPLLLWALL